MKTITYRQLQRMAVTKLTELIKDGIVVTVDSQPKFKLSLFDSHSVNTNEYKVIGGTRFMI